jgi:hypothetical protein
LKRFFAVQVNWKRSFFSQENKFEIVLFEVAGMKTFCLSILIFISLLCSSKTAVASCSARQSVKKEAETVALIFIGKAIKITPSQFAVGERISSRLLKWEKRFMKTDVVTFKVIESFKGATDETVDIATSVEGDANYTFEGGTWLTEGQTYLVYANKIMPAGTVDKDDKDYSPAANAEFRRIQKAFPKDLAAEINEYNGKITKFYAGVCGRTAGIEGAAEEVREIRVMFPQSKTYNSSANEFSGNQPVSIWQRLLNLFGLV